MGRDSSLVPDGLPFRMGGGLIRNNLGFGVYIGLDEAGRLSISGSSGADQDRLKGIEESKRLETVKK